ncbi:hypothetical protein K435DRAFT_1844 [Dendrothele bispora CBS 962.96]|uniref:Uncharacterized protein n=1 Tax=Dendrothele bispora (strain CBS 962.96) TaxID=1314807 RepID=A0A4V4HIV8_DENBC|nr:hypothetical protein K435DRAFT_1844 [Dendrothele bispora CBS 962.96]
MSRTQMSGEQVVYQLSKCLRLLGGNRYGVQRLVNQLRHLFIRTIYFGSFPFNTLTRCRANDPGARQFCFFATGRVFARFLQAAVEQNSVEQITPLSQEFDIIR